jgi:hypothetical protein
VQATQSHNGDVRRVRIQPLVVKQRRGTSAQPHPFTINRNVDQAIFDWFAGSAILLLVCPTIDHMTVQSAI